MPILYHWLNVSRYGDISIYRCISNTYIHTCIHTYIHTYIHPYIHTYIRTYVRTYIHQFKLDRTDMQQGHDTTRFSFHTHASLRVHARLVTSNLPCKALMYTLDVCTMHACMSGMYMSNLDYTCMQIVS